jgi:hypothetical protein
LNKAQSSTRSKPAPALTTRLQEPQHVFTAAAPVRMPILASLVTGI